MDTLKEKLAQLVYDYSIKGKTADRSFCEKVINLCVDGFDINDYVKSYNVESGINEAEYAGYDIGDKSLIVNLLKSKQEVLSRINDESRGGIVSSKFLTCVKVNIEIVHSIVHEITHACQYKKCLEGKDDLEKGLLELSFVKNLALLRGDNLSKEFIQYCMMLDELNGDKLYYISLPSERMADIRGLEFERDISKLITSKKKGNIETYTSLRLLLGKMLAYKECAPTALVVTANETIKKSVGLDYNSCDVNVTENGLTKLSRKNNFSLDDKLFYGFPITKDEKQNIDEEVKVLKRSLF